MEYENKYASKGVAGAGLGLGIAGTALGLMGGGLNGLLGGYGGFGGYGGNGWGGRGYGCGENCGDSLVNRYEAKQSARIAELEAEVKLRDANIYTDSKLLDLYKFFDGEVKDIRNTLCSQAVMNQKTADAFEAVKSDMCCCKNELYTAIARERDERRCSDNTIVNYVNATFYPKQIADVTVGATTTAQVLYNPLIDPDNSFFRR